MSVLVLQSFGMRKTVTVLFMSINLYMAETLYDWNQIYGH